MERNLQMLIIYLMLALFFLHFKNKPVKKGINSFVIVFKFNRKRSGFCIKKNYICAMLKVKVNNKNEHKIVFDNATSGTINGNPFVWDLIEIKPGSFHVIKDNKSYNVEVVEVNYSEKSFLVNVKGNNYQLQVEDKFDELLKSLGFDNLNSSKVNEIKAPMPGLVIDVCISEGDTIKKGDPVIVLEAMKMENIIKSTTDGIIKKINVKKGMAVEKSQVLINFA